MRKKVYIGIFVAIIVGIIMGYVIAAQAYNSALPNHALQQVTTDETGTTSVDTNANAQIDNADLADVATNANNANTVTDLSGNIYMYTSPPLITTTGFVNGQWTGSLPQGSVPNIPTNAEYAIIEYTLSAVATTCNWAVINFHGQDPRPTNGAGGSVNLQEVGGQRIGQVIIPLRPGQGNFWFQYQYSGTGCSHQLALQGYIM